MTIAKSKLPLKAGMSGPEVKEAQLALAARRYPLHGTGYFGPATRDAVKAFQIISGLKSTGIIDLDTAIALDRPVAPSAPINVTKQAPPWLIIAINNIGVAEIVGKGNNPVVMAMAKKCGGQIAKNYTNDEIPWCKMFTEYCAIEAGYRMIDSLWALDNLKAGVKLNGPAVGAFASKKRSGGGHTFIVAGKDKNGKIVGVGGNQTNKVSRATFLPSEIVGYNWPEGYELPTKTGMASLPVVDSAPLSKREA